MRGWAFRIWMSRCIGLAPIRSLRVIVTLRKVHLRIEPGTLGLNPSLATGRL